MPLEPSPIYLIGFMATGKTTVGRLVAEKLGRAFVDLDERIEAAAGKSIPEIFKAEGEIGFRRLEAAAVQAVALDVDQVIACGGGAPCFGDNLARMRATGVVVALRASIDEILRRAGAEPGTRPLLDAPEGARAVAERLFRERQAVYESADVVVDSDGRDAAVIADEVVRRVSLRLGDLAVRLGERSYPILLQPLAQAGVLARELFGAGVTAVGLVSDENVARAGHAETVRAALEAAGVKAVEMTIPAGERSKTLAEVERVAAACVAGGLDRRSAILAVGGGVVGDLAGFVAAILYRGIPFGQVATTLVAMVDSAIGGKTGVDLRAGKNLVGAFWQPRFVLCDTSVLKTLPARELLAAHGEVLKYALLGDPPLFAELEASPGNLRLSEVVRRSARQKALVVTEDERETTGARALLNLGHTVGHAIEAASGAMTSGPEALLHGEAVALGLIAAARVSGRLALCDRALEGRVAEVVRRLGLPADLDPWLRDDVLAYVKVDKKRLGANVRFVALEAVGKPRLVELAPDELGRILRNP